MESLRQASGAESEFISDNLVEFNDPSIHEQDLKLDEINVQLKKLNEDVKRYITRLYEIRDSGKDNAIVASNIAKQIQLHDSCVDFMSRTDQYALSLIFDEMKPALEKNSLIFENFARKYEEHILMMGHTQNDIAEALDTIARLRDFRAECLRRINSIVS